MGRLLAEHEGSAARCQRVVEMDQVFGNAIGADVVGAVIGGVHLVRIFERGRDRVVDRVDLLDEVADVELQLDQL